LLPSAARHRSPFSIFVLSKEEFSCTTPHPRKLSRKCESKTIGKNFAWRSFFHGGNSDQPENWRPQSGEQLKSTRLSAVFQSKASHYWIVAIAAPVIDPRQNGKFLGVVALTVRANHFAELEGNEDRKVVLVDLRPGEHTGLVLQHPLYDDFIRAAVKPPMLRLQPDDFPTRPERQRDYRDPAASVPEGADYNRHWLAWMDPVRVRGQDVGWGVIVQQSYERAIGSALPGLRAGLIRYGLAAVGMIVVVLLAMWGLAFRLLRVATPLRRSLAPAQASERSATATSPTGTAQARAVRRALPWDNSPRSPNDRSGGA